MDYFTPGLRELGRKFQRGSLRLALWQRQRSLARAETQLGLLGWQQADFDPETQRQVDAINNVEREQGRLINDAAERSAAIRQRRSELEAKHREHQEQLRALAQEEKKARDARDEMERRLADVRKLEPNLERRMPELDRELREVSRQLSQLLSADWQTPKQRQDLVRLRERTVAIPNEKNDLRTQHFRAVTEIRSLEQELEQGEQARTGLSRQKQQREQQWQAEESALEAAIKEVEREKARLEKRIAELERSKANPYQQIGQVLSLANVAPMNQPQALEAAKKIESAIAGLQETLQSSTQASAAENRQVLLSSYWLLFAVLVSTAVILWAAM